MQKLLLPLIALTTLASAGSAFAAPDSLSCREMNQSADYGYSALLQDGKAIISEITIAGSQRIATLDCRVLPPRPGSFGGDQIRVTQVCGEKQMADAGYSLVVKSGGLAGLTTATLSEITIAGARPVANLICNRGN